MKGKGLGHYCKMQVVMYDLLGLYHSICNLLFYRLEGFSDCSIIIIIVIFRIKC